MTRGKARFKSWAIYWAGWGFLAIGVLGLFLPILQGILFLLIGLLLLSNSSPRAARALDYIRVRFPRLSRKLEAARNKAAQVQAGVAAHFESKSGTGDAEPHKQAGHP